ncbi:MAG: hypothetical protein HWQ38_24555 [Nostoc sp. NMS7]|uniref:hypothetical protein n=1 Tax=uncultured Nostoc sp. TaxID=340711 RepID=UPI0035CA3D84|nr:hypothetical protein [Nostoc sp. NMS7]
MPVTDLTRLSYRFEGHWALAHILHQATGSRGYTGKTLDFMLVRAGGLPFGFSKGVCLYSRDF